jgi:hypothetical protein
MSGKESQPDEYIYIYIYIYRAVIMFFKIFSRTEFRFKLKNQIYHIANAYQSKSVHYMLQDRRTTFVGTSNLHRKWKDVGTKLICIKFHHNFKVFGTVLYQKKTNVEYVLFNSYSDKVSLCSKKYTEVVT